MMFINKIKVLVVSGLLLIMSNACAENDPHAYHRKLLESEQKQSLAKVTLPSIVLLNQFGKSVNIKDDVIAERIAVVTFAYTTCTTVCPVVSAIFSQVYKKLNNLVGKDVALVTITVDPNRDTASRLLAYSKKFRGGNGWTWLTGKKSSVIKTLSAFGAYTVNFEDHPAMILVGDAKNNKWYRYYGFTSPEIIVTKVKELLAQR